MPVTGQASTSDSITYESVNANTLWTTTESLDMGDARNIGLFVKGTSGTYTTLVVTLMIYDGAHWWDTIHTITGEGQLHEILCIAKEVKARVSTVEGAPSTVYISIIIK